MAKSLGSAIVKGTKDQTGKINGAFGSIENIDNKYTTDCLLRIVMKNLILFLIAVKKSFLPSTLILI
jgi:hypothetical protein